MNNRFHKIMSTLCLAGVLTGCSEWDDHYENLSGVGGSESTGAVTVWQQLTSNEELKDFCEVLEKTKVFRMHKTTPVTYKDLLNSGQSFTVVAPIKINKDSLLNLLQTSEGDSLVERAFVQNHLSRTLTSDKTEDGKMRKMNFKRVDIGNGKIDGVTIKTSNIHASNGIIHVVETPLPYSPNIFEALYDVPELRPIGTLLRKYEEEELNVEASVSNGIIDGVPVYVDSVMTERNRMLEGIGELNAEDSTYAMVVPSADGWAKAWNEALNFFTYSSKTQKRDSLQQFYTTRALLEDGAFNMTDQISFQDSAISVLYDRLKPEYHVFYKPFDQGGIMANAQQIKCSNGTIYKTADWSYTPELTYYKRLRSEAEQQSLILKEDEKDCVYFSRNVAADSVSENSYLEIKPLKPTSQWETTFRVDNTLSAKYNVYAIVLPKSVNKAGTPDERPNKFKATITYVAVNGDTVSVDCKVDGKTDFVSNALQVDTILLAENFPSDDLPMPACNYGQEGVKFKVKLKCNISALTEQKKYNRIMFLDCIYLSPCNSKSEEQ